VILRTPDEEVLNVYQKSRIGLLNWFSRISYTEYLLVSSANANSRMHSSYQYILY
jgi:hypothetical protein